MGSTRCPRRRRTTGRFQRDIGITAALLVAVLSAVVLAGCRAEPSATVVSNRALSGVVKFVDANRLVITRSGKDPAEMTFVLIPTTHREGPISVGTTVQVRFRSDRRTLVATAILATDPKQHAGTVP
jgi:hypothetical protein